MKDGLNITSQVERQLFALVRAALWQLPPDLSSFRNSVVDWAAIREVARRQTVELLAYRGAMELPDCVKPPRQWIIEACAEMERNRRAHHLLDNCVAEAVACLRNVGINPVLLKGQAYACSYPEPYLRKCGDIDIYVGTRDFAASREAVTSAGWVIDGIFDPVAKHHGSYLRGVHVEIHRVPAILASNALNRRFEEWSSRQLSDSCRDADIGGVRVAVPPSLFDIVFVFLHLYIHFINGGVGLRQLCDWAMLLHANVDNIDLDELESLLKDFRLLYAWRMFTPIVVDYLGLDSQECPFYSPELRGKAEKILNFIMKDGNFGKFSPKRTPRPEEYLRGKLHTFYFKSRRSVSIFLIDPATVIRNYIKFLRVGCRQVYKDLATNKRHED